MHETYRCYRCAYDAQQPMPQCPQCGGRLLTVKKIRQLGWVLAATGSFIVVFIGGIIIVVARIIFWPPADATTRFAGEVGDALLIFSILYTVLVFGLVGLAAGISQIRYGRRNRKLAYLMLGLALLLYAIAMVVNLMA